MRKNEEIGELPPNVTNKQALSSVDTLRMHVERQSIISKDTIKTIVNLENIIDTVGSKIIRALGDNSCQKSHT